MDATRTSNGSWNNSAGLPARRFVCGLCAARVSSVLGYVFSNKAILRNIPMCYVCPNCNGLNVFDFKYQQQPAPVLGIDVSFLPEELDVAYREARACTGQGCYTASVLLCRKMLMNIAVEKKAKAGQTFAFYIDYLANLNYIPPDGKDWVDHIRKKGNEATHEISIMSEKDASDLLIFLGQLLKFIYEFPAMLNKPHETSQIGSAGPDTELPAS